MSDDPKYGAYNRAKELGKYFEGTTGKPKGGGVSANGRPVHPIRDTWKYLVNMWLQRMQKNKPENERIRY